DSGGSHFRSVEASIRLSTISQDMDRVCDQQLPNQYRPLPSHRDNQILEPRRQTAGLLLGRSYRRMPPKQIPHPHTAALWSPVEEHAPGGLAPISVLSGAFLVAALQ